MASFVLTDADVTINSVDLSAYVQSVTINYEAEEQDDTAMGDTARSYKAGLTNWSADVTFIQDHGAGAVDATLFSLIGSDPVTCIFKPTSGAVSATNPSYTGSAMVSSYTPVNGSVGDLATAPVTLRGSGALTRATS